MDCNDRVATIVLAPEQHLEFDLLYQIPDLFEHVSEFGLDLGTVVTGFTCELDQGFRVTDLSGDFLIEFDALFQPSLLPQDVAGLFLIRPKARISDQSVQFVNALLFRRAVKETSGFPDCDLSDARILQEARRSLSHFLSLPRRDLEDITRPATASNATMYAKTSPTRT